MGTKKAMFVAILIIAAFFVGVFASSVVRADELDDITKQLATLSRDLQDKEANQQALARQLSDIRARVSFVESEIPKREREIADEEKQLAHLKDRLDDRIVSYYKSISKNFVSIINFLVATNLDNSLRVFFYQQTVISEDRRNITNTVRRILALDEKKKELVSEKQRLASANAEIDRQSKLIGSEINSKRQQIAQLSEKQQQLTAQKLASLNIPRSAGTSARGCSDDRHIDPGFSPRLALFSYGAPHRNGLNQYGAWGRAKAGQNEETILSEYYPGKTLRKDYSQSIQISTTTGWSGSIEDYVKRIYEVPDSWTDNNLAVLKAQAVAARSYALNVTADGSKQICTSEQCQVFKADPKGGNWEQAVNATAGWVLTDGGSPAFTQYASTHGGYILNLGKFDGSGGNPSSFSELNERAYDKASPWFYCDWGARGAYGNTAWLKSSEVADIVNVLLLTQKDGSTGSHLSQTDGGASDTWDAEKVKSELRARGGSPFNSVTSMSMSADFGSGKTTSVTVSGDAGSTSFSGDYFKTWFNVRAPANIFITGPLFNAEIQ